MDHFCCSISRSRISMRTFWIDSRSISLVFRRKIEKQRFLWKFTISKNFLSLVKKQISRSFLLFYFKVTYVHANIWIDSRSISLVFGIFFEKLRIFMKIYDFKVQLSPFGRGWPPIFFPFCTSQNDKLSNDTTFSIPKVPGKLWILSFKIEI